MDQRNSSVSYSFRICLCKRVLCGNGLCGIVGFWCEEIKGKNVVCSAPTRISRILHWRRKIKGKKKGIFNFRSYCTNDFLKLINFDSFVFVVIPTTKLAERPGLCRVSICYLAYQPDPNSLPNNSLHLELPTLTKPKMMIRGLTL